MSTEEKHRESCTQKDIASMFGVSVRTVRNWRELGCPHICIGKAQKGKGLRVRYALDEVSAWLRSRSTCRGRVSAEAVSLAESMGQSFNQTAKEVKA